MDRNGSKYVYFFGNGTADGDRSMRDLLGGKGANLAEMSSIGLPVPPGFTISTETCRYYTDEGSQWPDFLDDDVKEGVRHVEGAMAAGFGDPANPLLVSVRSGAAISMPGMMDTVLNLGLNTEVAEGLAGRTGNERFVYDAYRRLIDMFGDVVMGVHHSHFEHAIEGLKKECGVELDVDLTAEDLKTLVSRYRSIYQEHTGSPFPEDPFEQLRLAADAVFKSWNVERAVKYRQINKITHLLGTAVNVQAMVFGNMGKDCGTGVCFTRDPANGEKRLYGEFLVNAQGEDVVAGIRTPVNIDRMEEVFPQAYRELLETTSGLERHYQNIQDIEFTIQQNRLFILQTRNGERTGAAALKIAVDMVNEGLVEKSIAVNTLVEPRHLGQLLHPQFEDVSGYGEQVIARGLPASPGAAVGQVVFSANQAEAAKEAGKQVVLVRVETTAEDVGGMNASEGILTSRGGMTSHAAVVARGWGKPCVAGCSAINIDDDAGSFSSGGVTVRQDDWISINGSTGEVILGQQDLVEPELGGDFSAFMEWVDEFRTMKVRTNADAPDDAAKARGFGAQGIGLCRTEHMFFEDDRIQSMREMILARSQDARREALAKLLPYQKEDFRGIFRAMDGFPVTIRLLDPPLHEFLPHEEADQLKMAESMGLSAAEVAEKVVFLSEINPMLGHRGCRLGILYPEITEMQSRAILEAAVELDQEGVRVLPEIMVPLVGTLREFSNQKDVIRATAERVFAKKGAQVEYLIGTMIEVPRAALTAGEIAPETDFFSFGTNDLTQMTFGYSRDDTMKFLPDYIVRKILPENPFESIDRNGVGQLVRLGTEAGRAARPGLKVGICGEHGGDPSSVHFCFEVGMDYVSCSPFRVPIARLAAAQAALRAGD